eukprot:TRINITY_DN8275_c0_g2_i2.p1 TRINITY_DN8275_c0_g2~~TRINITY_DN8275_c0_g2_i2.p1  ORF type:complete len:289 (-),score=48.47 TRINITY_DN8275_c0_g2_i2:48-914(-)
MSNWKLNLSGLILIWSCQAVGVFGTVSIFLRAQSPVLSPPISILEPTTVQEPTVPEPPQTTVPEPTLRNVLGPPPAFSPPVQEQQQQQVPVQGSPQLPRFQPEGVTLPFEPVDGYPMEYQGIWIADPNNYKYRDPEDVRKLEPGAEQCEILFSTNLGISLYDYSPVSKCSDLGVLNPLEFLAQLEGADIAYGTEFTVYYALLSLQCTGDQEGTLIEVSSDGNYQCIKFKRIENQLFLTYGYIYGLEEDVQCPQSWDVDLSTDIFADSQIVYETFDTGVFSSEQATCIG